MHELVGGEAVEDLVEVFVLIEQESLVDQDPGPGDLCGAGEGGRGLAEALEIGDDHVDRDIVECVADAHVFHRAADPPELAPDLLLFGRGGGFDAVQRVAAAGVYAPGAGDQRQGDRAGREQWNRTGEHGARLPGGRGDGKPLIRALGRACCW
ncbi:MAG: hypothetical protein HND58_04960 [Planctomycetota bacterium]|nr:MAG: hypothetical protein HND58_04960 [Planctomycetota bacterium]